MQVQKEQLPEEILRMFSNGYDLHTWYLLVLGLQKQHLKSLITVSSFLKIESKFN